MVSMIGHAVVQLIDNVMVGQLGTAELAAVSLGISFVVVAMSLGIGFSTAITPLIAEASLFWSGTGFGRFGTLVTTPAC